MQTQGSDSQPQSLWRNRNWQRLWGATSTSNLGDIVFDITAVLWIGTVLTKGTSWGPMAVSGLMLCSIVPMMALGTVAGALADRLPTKATMMVCNAVQGALIASLVPLTLMHETIPLAGALAWIYAAVAGSNFAGVVFGACEIKMVVAAVPEQHWSLSSSQLQGTNGLIAIVGPPLAAPLMFAAGPWLAFALNAGSFVLSCVLLVSLPAAKPGAQSDEGQAKSFAAEIKDGFVFVFKHPVLRALIISITAVTLGTSPFNSLQVYFVPENLHVDASMIGFLSGSIGAGTMVGAFASAAVVGRIGTERAYTLLVFGVGCALIIYSRMGNLVAACLVMASLGLMTGAINAALNPMLMRATPAHLLGRVAGVIGPIQQSAAVAGIGVAGFCASGLGEGFRADVGLLTFQRIDLIYTVCGLIVILAVAATCRPLLRAAKTDQGDTHPEPDQSAAESGPTAPTDSEQCSS